MCSTSEDNSICSESTSLDNSSSSSSLSHNEIFVHSKHADISFNHIKAFFQQHQLTDVTLIAGNKRIPAHKIVLCAATDYFKAMFMTNLKESTQQEVEIKDVDEQIMSDLVGYCYTGNIDIREDTVELLLSTASLLQFTEIMNACSDFLAKQLHPSNSIGICLFADRQSCLELKEAAHNYTAENFMEVIQNREFTNLPEEDVYKLLSSDDLNVPDEEDIFRALITWLDHNKDSVKNVSKLLSLVRLPLLEPSFIADQVETQLILRNDPQCQVLIMEALKYHLLPERRSVLQNCRTHPRKSTVGLLYTIGGIDANKSAITIEQYNYRSDNWAPAAKMNGRRLQFGVAAIDNKIYVIGGRDGLKTLNSVEYLDMKTKTWYTLPPMITHRHGLGVAVLDRPLYAIGGHDGWSYLNTVERWDPDLRQWSFVSPMSTSRSTLGVAVLNNKLYAVGGRDGSSCLKTVEYYDPHTNKWTSCCAMIKRRCSVGVGVLNGYLYAVGGYDAPATNPSASRFDCIERYDPKTDSWTLIANMSIGRDCVGIGILGDRLFAVGGYDGQNYLSLVEIYDASTNEWKQVAPLPTGRAGTGVVTLKYTNKD